MVPSMYWRMRRFTPPTGRMFVAAQGQMNSKAASDHSKRPALKRNSSKPQ